MNLFEKKYVNIGLFTQRIQDLEKKLNESVEQMEIQMSKDGSILELYEFSNLISLAENMDEELRTKIKNYHIDFNTFMIDNPPMLSLFERGKLINKTIMITYDYHIEVGEELHQDITNYLNTK